MEWWSGGLETPTTAGPETGGTTRAIQRTSTERSSSYSMMWK